MRYWFDWNEWNRDKLAKHGVTPDEVEYVITHARRPFPRLAGDKKRLVWGQTEHGRFIQVAYLVREDDSVFVIHARPLNDREKRRYRRSQR